MYAVNFPIDIVLPWVDGSDIDWQEKKKKYVPEKKDDAQRYRDLGTLKYVLRSIEKFAPWVNHIFLITDHQRPAWLADSSKISVVDHQSFIPAEYLPTFNSNVIELNAWKIKGLSEHFILFNDDTLLIKPTRPTDFFTAEGQPMDNAAQFVLSPADSFAHIAVNNIVLINNKFSKRNWLKNNFLKAFSLKNGFVLNVYSVLLSVLPRLTRFYDPHIPLSYTRANFANAEATFSEEFVRTFMTKTRDLNNISHWVVRYSQLMSGDFSVRSSKFGLYLNIQEVEKFSQVLKKKYPKVIVLNDTIANDRELTLANETMAKLETYLPEKSSYEQL